MITTTGEDTPKELPPKQHHAATITSPPPHFNNNNRKSCNAMGSSWNHWDTVATDVTFGFELPTQTPPIHCATPKEVTPQIRMKEPRNSKSPKETTGTYATDASCNHKNDADKDDTYTTIEAAGRERPVQPQFSGTSNSSTNTDAKE